MPLKSMLWIYRETFNGFTCPTPTVRFWILYLLHPIPPRQLTRKSSGTRAPAIPQYGRDSIWPPRRFGIRSHGHRMHYQTPLELSMEFTRFSTLREVTFWHAF